MLRNICLYAIRVPLQPLLLENDFTSNISSSNISIPLELNLPKVLFGHIGKSHQSGSQSLEILAHLHRLVIVGGEPEGCKDSKQT